MFFWKHDVPIVISDIDGTITKSDALGQVLHVIGRDWTHQGVAKLYTDIVNNGYNIFYLTSRSVGQADMTRAYLNGVAQDTYRLPKGPVIMSPDRTIAALRREVYLRKPEVFKMACLRDIMQLFDKPVHQTPFYAGFGNRFTDALSYRSVNIPSTRIFTINSNAEVSLDVLSLNSYKTGYASMREIVDHFFPPVGLLVPAGGENYTDFNYWREKPLDIEDFTDSEDDDDEDDETEAASIRSEDEGSEAGEDLEASYMTQDSLDEPGMENSILDSIEGDDYVEGEQYADDRGSGDEEDEDEDEEDEEVEEFEEGVTPTTQLIDIDPIVERTSELGIRDATPTPRTSPRK
jgi:phosphatidate phosphatase LPIN